MIVQTRQIDIVLSPEELAKEFWAMTADKQARFFNRLGLFDAVLMHIQLQYVTDDNELTDEGRRVMKNIGEHASNG